MEGQEQLVFRIDEKLLQHRPPRLILAGTLRALAERVDSGNLKAKFVVDILDENRLIPYIIGNVKNIENVALGRQTNASKIGDIIVSEECIRGTYDLCLSFLEFVRAVILDPHYVDSSKSMLAALTYIANEIYPNHHIWTYKNIKNMHRILHLCTEIFYHVVMKINPPHPHNQLEVICVFNLTQNQAHKQLIDVIVQGHKEDGEGVNCTRQSLKIFNRLLSCTSILEKYQLQSADRQALVSTPMTNIERALFDTSIRPGLLQHLFSYIYKKEDNTTACLVVDLVKKIAEKFSMSLMACLGSEAERVCEFFIKCLSKSSDDQPVDLEISILDLLSVCVKHQPGLIELFLNLEGSSKALLDLLGQCKTQDDDSHTKLHSYLMKFILTFWQKSHSAIEQFDKAEDFWDSVAHPLVRFSDNNSGNTTISPIKSKINSYALMILAREIFSINAGISEREMNPKLKNKLNELGEKNFLGKYSASISKEYSLMFSDQDKDSNCILAAWRDFLTSFSKYKPFEIKEGIQKQIVENILTCMTTELKLCENLDRERIAAIGETLLLVWTKWMGKNSSSDSIFNSIHEILYLTDSCKEYLPFSFLLTFQSTLNLYLMRNRDYLINSKRSFDLLVPSLQMMQFSLKIMEKYINEKSRNIEFEYKPGLESRLCQASIMTLRFIIDVARSHANLWISYIQTNLKTDSLVQFLTLLVNKRAGPEVCLSVVELLLCLSSVKEAADYLKRACLINQVNMIAVSAYERPYAHLSQLASANSILQNKQSDISGAPPTNQPSIRDTEKTYLDNMNSNLEWLPIFRHVIRLNISMILTLGNDYMGPAVEFLSIHCIRICETIELLRTKPRSINMDEALQMIYLINLVLRHGSMWMRKSRQSYLSISEEIAKTAYTLATSALPPPVSSDSQAVQHTSLRPKDCLVYARCCYDLGKYTEAERVLFQTKFGDKNGFIKEAAQIYGAELSIHAFHLASLISIKTNRQSDSIDFASQVFADDPEHFEIVNALTQNRV